MTTEQLLEPRVKRFNKILGKRKVWNRYFFRGQFNRLGKQMKLDLKTFIKLRKKRRELLANHYPATLQDYNNKIK